MKRYRVHVSSPDIRTFNLPFADVSMPDACDENDAVWRAAIIATARVDIDHVTRPLVERLGFVPRLRYSIQRLPTPATGWRGTPIRVVVGKAVV